MALEGAPSADSKPSPKELVGNGVGLGVVSSGVVATVVVSMVSGAVVAVSTKSGAIGITVVVALSGAAVVGGFKHFP